MSKRIRVVAGLIVFGCFLFLVYGVLAAVFSEWVASHQYQAVSGRDFQELAEEVRVLVAAEVFVVGLMGAGLSLCAGALFWYGLARRMAGAFIFGLIGGTAGVNGLIAVHFQHKIWDMFIVDNACLFFIVLGMTIGGREMWRVILNRTEKEPTEG